jgi:hypothetical protein
MFNQEKSNLQFAAGEQVSEQLTDPHALLTAMQKLRQEVAQESRSEDRVILLVLLPASIPHRSSACADDEDVPVL